MKPQDFVPEFDDSVFEFHKNINTPDNDYPVNPRYCLTETSAKLLATFFTPQPAIFDAPPIGQAVGSPFGFNRNVPWFRFANGVVRNAAVLAQYWGMPGVPLANVMDYVTADIATPVEGQ